MSFTKERQLRKILASGYVYLYIPSHPFSTKAGFVMEHRLFVEKQIGRYLTEKEVVHHINGKKDDNNLANLKLMTRIEHQIFHNKIREYSPHTEETKRKIGEKSKGHVLSAESRRKIGQSNLGKHKQLGESNPNAKLKVKDVIEIKKRLETGECQRNIAKDYGVLGAAISRIKLGKSWKCLQLTPSLC